MIKRFHSLENAITKFYVSELCFLASCFEDVFWFCLHSAVLSYVNFKLMVLVIFGSDCRAITSNFSNWLSSVWAYVWNFVALAVAACFLTIKFETKFYMIETWMGNQSTKAFFALSSCFEHMWKKKILGLSFVEMSYSGCRWLDVY